MAPLAPAQVAEAAEADVDELARSASGSEDESASLSGSEDESDDVTPEGVARIMALLGDDAAALLDGLGADDDAEDDEDEDEVDEDEEASEDEVGGELDVDDLEGSESDAVSPERLLEDASDDEDAVAIDRVAVNNSSALDRIAANVRIPGLDFFDTLTLTYPEALGIADASDDLNRELAFYKQALWAAEEGQRRFAAAGKPFKRPDDFYAEMVKSDEHMARVRQRLLNQTAALKASDEAKRQRNLKKFGKKVQVEKRLERERDKKAVGDRIKDFRRKRKGEDAQGGGGADDFDIELDDDAPPSKRKRLDERGSSSASRGRGRGRGGGKMSRIGRDAKFGFGGQGRRSKQNDRKSLDAPSSSRGRGRGGSRGGSRGGGGGGGGGKKPQRPGKSKRNASRGR